MNKGGLEGKDGAGRRFRDALACFATGVAVVTTRAGGEDIGITVNSFASVSLEPPLVLWCLSLDSGLVKHFRKGTPFAVNFLSRAQRDLAVQFARPGENRFEGVPARAGKNGAPLLPGAAGALECATVSVHSGGDHVIILGRVQRFETGKAPPLLFHRGRFRTF